MASRLRRFHVKDRAYIQAFVHETHCNLFPDIHEEIEREAMYYEHRFRLIHNESENKSNIQKRELDSYWHVIGSLSRTFEDLAYKVRLVDNDVDNFVAHGLVVSRIRYCGDMADGAAAFSFDCSHVAGLIWSLAFSDWLAVGKYIQLRPGIASYGHRELRETCNALTALLKGNALPDSLMAALRGKIGPRTRCVLSSLEAIFRGDEAAFSKHLHQIANSHRRTDAAFGLARYFSPEAHAFLNLAQHIHGCSFAANFNSASPVWDPEFQAHSKLAMDLSIIDRFSPALTKVASKLPTDVPPDFFGSLRRNWTQTEWQRVVLLAETESAKTDALIAEQLRKTKSEALERDHPTDTQMIVRIPEPSKQSGSLRNRATSLFGLFFGRD